MKQLLIGVLTAFTLSSPAVAENALFSPLPEGYQELEWVESDGTQAVNTDYKPMGDDRVWMVATPKAYDITYFCARGGMANSYFEALLASDGRVRLDSGSTPTFSTLTQTVGEKKYEMDFNFDTGTVKVDGDNWITGAAGKNAAERASHLWLFALLDAGNTADKVTKMFKIRCYAFKVFHKNGLPVMNLIPCVKLDDGKVGFYDVVRNRFLDSSTGTSLNPGPKASPHVVRLLQWVETTGDQYIDTGYFPVNTDTMKMRVSIEEADKESGTFFCARGEGYNSYYELILGGEGKIRMDKGSKPQLSTKTIPTYGVPHTYRSDFNAGTTAVDGVHFITVVDTTAEQIQPNSLYLFALHNAANSLPMNYGKMKFFGAKLEGKDGTVKLGLYPAKDETTGECGVYDAVSKKFIGFIGSSPVVEGPRQNRYQELEWVESDGTQAVNTDYKPMGDDRVWMVAMPKTLDVSYFCARGGEMANSWFEGLMLGDATIRLDTGDKATPSSEKQSVEVKYEMDFNFDTGSVKVDGVNWITGATGKNAAERKSNLWLFALLDAGNTADKVTKMSKIRCYAFKVFHKDGTPVMDLVPCLDSFTGDVGFYDKVRARFIGPTTGGLLKGGDPVESSDAAFTMSVAGGQADLTFAASSISRKLYFAYGNTDCGNTTFGWNQVQEVQDIAAGVTELKDVAIPEGFGMTYRVVRAILGNLYASNPQFATVPFEAKLRKACTQAELVFSGADETRELYVAWGNDAGEDLANWQNKAKLCDIPASLTSQTVDVSALKDSLRASKGCRFFLVGSSSDASGFVLTNRGLFIVVN